MGFGIVICDKCRRELHQNSYRVWIHCNDESIICKSATAVYCDDTRLIVGQWCGKDDVYGL